MADNFFKLLWKSVHEPKYITISMVLIYLVIFFTGVGYVSSDAVFNLFMIDEFKKVSGVLFIIAGVLGAPSAWRGMRWLESIAVVLAISSCVLTIYSIVVLKVNGVLAAPVSTMGFSAISLLALFMRHYRIKGTAFAPGKGPKTGVQYALESTVAAEAIRSVEEEVLKKKG